MRNGGEKLACHYLALLFKILDSCDIGTITDYLNLYLNITLGFFSQEDLLVLFTMIPSSDIFPQARDTSLDMCNLFFLA